MLVFSTQKVYILCLRNFKAFQLFNVVVFRILIDFKILLIEIKHLILIVFGITMFLAVCRIIAFKIKTFVTIEQKYNAFEKPIQRLCK